MQKKVCKIKKVNTLPYNSINSNFDLLYTSVKYTSFDTVIQAINTNINKFNKYIRKGHKISKSRHKNYFRLLWDILGI